MTPDLQREFQSLREKAMKELKNIAATGSYCNVFSLFVLPSFSPSRRFTVYSPVRPEKGHRPFVAFSTWRSDLDAEKLRSPIERLRYPKDLSPTIENDTLWLTDAEPGEIEQRIRSIAIPLYLGPPSVVGCDGTRFEFQYDALFFGATIHWWEDRPQEWRPFTETLIQIANELEERRQKTAQLAKTASTKS